MTVPRHSSIGISIAVKPWIFLKSNSLLVMFIGLQKDPDFFNGFRREVGATPLFTGTGIGVCPVNPRAAGGHKVAPLYVL